MEADPGLIGQGGHLLGPQHRRELAKHGRQTPGRHDRHALCNYVAPGDLGTVNGHDRHHHHHHHVGIGQDLGSLIRLGRHRMQCGGEGMAAMPQPPDRVELQPTAVLLGVDHEHPTGADHQVDALMAVKAPVADSLGGLGSWS
jgi:hypothetical protein